MGRERERENRAKRKKKKVVCTLTDLEEPRGVAVGLERGMGQGLGVEIGIVLDSHRVLAIGQVRDLRRRRQRPRVVGCDVISESL